MTLRRRVIERARALESLYPQLDEQERTVCRMMHEACRAYLSK